MKMACERDGAGRATRVGSETLREPFAHKFWRLAAFAAMAICSAAAQHRQPTEYEIKAVYIYDFSRFVEWPANAGPLADGFSICILGQDPFGESLNNALANVAIAGKEVAIKRISAPEEAEKCRVLFISGSEENRLKQILEALDGASILTVSDMPEFTARGGMMQFVWDGHRVRFEVNLTTAEHAGLILSSELLKVAVNVKRTGPGGD